jgi:hypothetical protein
MQTCAGMSIACSFERVPVANDVHEGDEQMEAGIERGVIAAQPLDDDGVLLRHHDRRLEEDEDDQQNREHEDDERRFHVSPHSGRMSS